MAEMKLGRIFEFPLLYIAMALFSLFIFLTYDWTAGIVLLGLSLLALGMYNARKPRLRINSTKGNTVQSVIFAIIALAVTVGLSIFVGMFVFGFTLGSVGDFITHNRAAVLGAETLPFAGNPVLTFILFVIAFPITETVVLLQVFDILLRKFKIGFNLNPIKNPLLYVAAAIMGIGAIFYHIYAKSTVAGTPNPNVLMVIFFIFFVEAILAAKTGEMEGSIYHHMMNNMLALMPLGG